MSSALIVTLSVLLVGCAAIQKGPPIAPTLEENWHTERAVHHVHLDVELDGGKREQRSLTGAIAIQKPDSFRLRALGPAGITLFDLLYVRGRVTILQSIKDAAKGPLGEIARSLGGDLALAYGLEPVPSDRQVFIDRGQRRDQTQDPNIELSDSARQVRLSRFRQVGGAKVPTHLEISNRERRYRVTVEVSDVEIDVALDPALFAE
jgi:hypothetical protein